MHLIVLFSTFPLKAYENLYIYITLFAFNSNRIHNRNKKEKMKDHYVVCVGNIGNIACKSKKEALRIYFDYVYASQRNFGRAAGERVFLLMNDVPIREYFPPLSEDDV
jgi:hypothetical protein